MPPVSIEREGDFWIARDDKIAGGTKRRALIEYLPTLGKKHFIYAGSVYGSGGWAVAEACRDLGYNCTLVIARSKFIPAWINELECNLEWRDNQPVEAIYTSLHGLDGLLPLGFDDCDFITCLSKIFGQIDCAPAEIWMPCVSGVLVRAALAAWPDKKINAVCSARHHGDIGRAIKYIADQKYHQPALNRPPYPANAFSDAKLWHFVTRFGLKNALVWNTSA